MLLGQIPFTLPAAVKTCHQINRYRQISTSKEKNFNMKSAGNAKIRMEESLLTLMLRQSSLSC